MTFFLTVLETAALMVLQHTVFPAETTLAEGAVTHDPLRRLLTVLVRAADLLGRYAASQR